MGHDSRAMFGFYSVERTEERPLAPSAREVSLNVLGQGCALGPNDEAFCWDGLEIPQSLLLQQVSVSVTQVCGLDQMGVVTCWEQGLQR